MLGINGIPDPPNDLGAFGRMLHQLQRQVELMAGARNLVAAAIGAGGLLINKLGNLTIRDGGGILVEDGGSVTITEGDLILGEGKIQGAALENQLQFATVNVRATNFGTGVDTFQTKATLTITPPEWATGVQVMAIGFIKAYVVDDYGGEYPVVRVGIGDTFSDEIPAFPNASDYDTAHVMTSGQATLGETLDVGDPVDVVVQIRTAKAFETNSRAVATINATVAYTR